jgi:hypothetical protein
MKKNAFSSSWRLQVTANPPPFFHQLGSHSSPLESKLALVTSLTRKMKQQFSLGIEHRNISVSVTGSQNTDLANKQAWSS